MTQSSNPGPSGATRDEDLAAMGHALALAASVRTRTSPNPWVGAVVVARGERFGGATAAPGGPHAEVAAIAAAGDRARGATLYSTLEPCAHSGRTGPCTAAIAAAGVTRVVVGVLDPDPHVSGRGVAELEAAGVTVDVGVRGDEVSEQLAPYLTHRRTGRPWVVLKLAATVDGRIAAPDGSSKWLTGPEARLDAHRLRAESDAVLVGAGTVRADDPALTVRMDGADDDLPVGAAGMDGPGGPGPDTQPLRVVLGHAPDGARVLPALELQGDLGAVLDELGHKGVLQVLVEGGSRVAHDFHAAGLVDRYVVYLAPALFGGDDGLAMFGGPGAASVDSLWRGRITSVARLGDDLRLDLAPATPVQES